MEGGQSAESLGKRIYYEFSRPDEKHILGIELEEISGLSWNGNNSLACIQDENGVIYIYDLGKKKVKKRIQFKSSGDFEGIEKIGKWFYVLKSNGKIYKVPEGSKGHEEVEVLKTPFEQKNDLEGLGLSGSGKNLVLAIKGEGLIGKKEPKGKGIFKFDLGKEKLQKDPIFSISKKMINQLFASEKSERKNDGIGISGIAFHPIEGNYYLISSVGKFLIVVSPKGKLLSYVKLPRKLFKQPEGICFDPKGNLYISNEAREGAANILFFSYRK